MNIFVGNLGPQTTDEHLKELFAEFGEVQSAKVIKDNYTGQSRGFAFVEVADQSAAEAAIAKLNSMSFMSQTITVNEARPKTASSGRGGGYGGGRR
ncbi:MAG: RNA-binding protein [Chitinophagaceae bacterium]|nr:MAG: RNA-binding protein [Chitinophagaceae bacterium]